MPEDPRTTSPAGIGGGFSRRDFLRYGGGLAVAATAGVALTACSSGSSSGSAASGGPSGTVRVLGWAAYVDPTIMKLWHEAYPNITLQTVLGASDADMFTKLKAGGTSAFDVGMCDGGWAPAYAGAGLVETMDVSSLEGSSGIAPVFLRQGASAPWVAGPGKVTIDPCEWAVGSLTFNTTVPYQLPQPYSWASLASNKIPKGKVGFELGPDDTLAVAGLATGVPIGSVYDMTSSDLKEAVKWLRSIKPFQVYSSDPETRDAIRTGNVWMAAAPTTGFAHNINLAAGKTVAKSVVPKEGALGYTDGMMLIKNAQNRENAMRFINFFATNPAVRKYVFEQYLGAPCNQNVVAALNAASPTDKVLISQLDGDQPELAAKMAQAKLPTDPEAYTNAWTQVIG
jgi:spermidine/putrescine transport system substrate-binding protein